MNLYVDEVLNGEPTYTLTHEDTTTETVKIELATEVVQQGTALNKAFFDSIKDDLNSRVLLSDKATSAQAIAGTSDTKWITPKTLNDVVKSYTTKETIENTTQPSTSHDITTDISSGKYIIYGKIRNEDDTGITSGSASSLSINGTRITIAELSNGTFSITHNQSAVSHTLKVSGSLNSYFRPNFIIEIDTNTKTFKYSIVGYSASNVYTLWQGNGTYSTLTSIGVSMSNGAGNTTTYCDYSIQHIL